MLFPSDLGTLESGHKCHQLLGNDLFQKKLIKAELEFGEFLLCHDESIQRSHLSKPKSPWNGLGG